MKIENFGEKIGGAKKDLWKERNFLISDLDCLSDREAFKFCVKDKIWKRPDYKVLCNGKPKLVVSCIKKLRDALPARVKPTSNEDKNKFNRKLFVELWGKIAEAAGKNIGKGKLIAVSGRIQTRNYEEKDGTKRYVTEVIGEETKYLWSKLENI
ncbi:single-stranded DNA-binding protein [Clostridium ljungdahlii]|uniref:Single-stranded DNA-binding protein SsbB n=1 Tax=Clostridium ljungdahlii TaxID=1538 RepID=A0A162N9U2_9CLOT|nr:single-stranded DNA-binding protein [Clostridium ljungdahlii]OAA90739.1 Single-stranded DNA-binding protein SsbB [Clostridium ljungdahlii]